MKTKPKSNNNEVKLDRCKGEGPDFPLLQNVYFSYLNLCIYHTFVIRSFSSLPREGFSILFSPSGLLRRGV